MHPGERQPTLLRVAQIVQLVDPTGDILHSQSPLKFHSWQGAEVRPSIAFDQGSQPVGRDEIGLVAQSREPACSATLHRTAGLWIFPAVSR